MLYKRGPQLTLVGSERKRPAIKPSRRETEPGKEAPPKPEDVSDWEGEGGRLDPPRKNTPTGTPAHDR